MDGWTNERIDGHRWMGIDTWMDGSVGPINNVWRMSLETLIESVCSSQHNYSGMIIQVRLIVY